VDEVEAHGGDAPDREQGEDLPQLHAAVRADEVERHQQCRRGGDVEQAPEHQAASAGGVGRLRHTFSERSSPTIPEGRNSRIRIIARNANVSLYSVMPVKEPTRGKSAVRKFSRKPRSSPPITAPGRLPMPPITAAANALMPGSTPNIAGWLMLPKLMPHITAAAAARIEPRRKVDEMTLSTSTPIMRAVSASCDVARMARPSRVRVTSDVRTSTRTRVTMGTSTTIQVVNTVSPATWNVSWPVKNEGGRKGV